MVTYSVNHQLQECDKVYADGKPVPAGYWDIRRSHRLVYEEGWYNWQTVHLATCVEELADVLEQVKQAIQQGKTLNHYIVLTEMYDVVNWQELTEYFRMRLTAGAL